MFQSIVRQGEHFARGLVLRIKFPLRCFGIRQFPHLALAAMVGLAVGVGLQVTAIGQIPVQKAPPSLIVEISDPEREFVDLTLEARNRLRAVATVDELWKEAQEAAQKAAENPGNEAFQDAADLATARVMQDRFNKLKNAAELEDTLNQQAAEFKQKLDTQIKLAMNDFKASKQAEQSNVNEYQDLLATLKQLENRVFQVSTMTDEERELFKDIQDQLKVIRSEIDLAKDAKQIDSNAVASLMDRKAVLLIEFHRVTRGIKFAKRDMRLFMLHARNLEKSKSHERNLRVAKDLLNRGDIPTASPFRQLYKSQAGKKYESIVQDQRQALAKEKQEVERFLSTLPDLVGEANVRRQANSAESAIKSVSK